MKKVVALAGGVGGAKLAWGLAQLLDSEELAVIVNTGDDFIHLGLSISPDIDTVCYTLANLANPVTGWGRIDETWNTLRELKQLGGPDWFSLGDQDIALHLLRTDLLQGGKSLTEVTQIVGERLGITHRVFPMSDSPVHTIVTTQEMGDLPFQEYFVKFQCQPKMRSVRFEGIEQARLSEQASRRLEECDWVIFCPSNPWVSISPILSVPGVKEIMETKRVIAVSPIIGGQTVKGPAAKMYQEMGITPSALAVAEHYGALLDGFILDSFDKDQASLIDQCGIIPLVTNTLMSDNQSRIELAKSILSFAEKVEKG
jgi:LPPG:FO 2-phospho-L-lactate transferase